MLQRIAQSQLNCFKSSALGSVLTYISQPRTFALEQRLEPEVGDGSCASTPEFSLPHMGAIFERQ